MPEQHFNFNLPGVDQDAMDAAVELVGRTGGKQIEIGYLDDDVPVEQARWYATVHYAGTRITVENHRGPVEAADALARRLLTGATCTHCERLIALSDAGAMAYAGARMADGTVMTRQRIRKLAKGKQCRWRRMAARWVRGCETGTDHG